MAALGQSLPKWLVRDMSVYPPTATVERTLRPFRKVPHADVHADPWSPGEG
jgi:hypothetical protein